MERVEGREFGQDEVVSVAGRQFFDCRFDGAVLEYDGSAGCHFERCAFTMCSYRLVGPAFATVHFLHFLSQQEPSGPAIVTNLMLEITGDPRLSGLIVG